MRQLFALPCLAAALLLASPATQARVARIVIDKIERLADGSDYEVLRGRAFGVLDPAAPGNAVITDLQLAPRNAAGLVEYTSTFQLSSRWTWPGPAACCGTSWSTAPAS